MIKVKSRADADKLAGRAPKAAPMPAAKPVPQRAPAPAVSPVDLEARGAITALARTVDRMAKLINDLHVAPAPAAKPVAPDYAETPKPAPAPEVSRAPIPISKPLTSWGALGTAAPKSTTVAPSPPAPIDPVEAVVGRDNKNRMGSITMKGMNAIIERDNKGKMKAITIKTNGQEKVFKIIRDNKSRVSKIQLKERNDN
jgi:hypothetical protein